MSATKWILYIDNIYVAQVDYLLVERQLLHVPKLMSLLGTSREVFSRVHRKFDLASESVTIDTFVIMERVKSKNRMQIIGTLRESDNISVF